MFGFIAGYMLGSSGNKDCDCNNKSNGYGGELNIFQVFLMITIFVILFSLFFVCTNYFSNIILNFFGCNSFLDTINSFKENSTPAQLMLYELWLHRDFILITNIIFTFYIMFSLRREN